MFLNWDFYYFYSSDVANAWLETLLDVIDLLPKDVIKRDVSISFIIDHIK